MTNFDDTLDAQTTEQGAIDRALEMARDRGREDSSDDFCAACMGETPLAFGNARNAATVNWFADLSAAASNRVAELNGDDAARVHWWLRGDLADAYEAGYFGAASAPEDCDVCANQSQYDGCGHTMYGEPCPVADGGDGE